MFNIWKQIAVGGGLMLVALTAWLFIPNGQSLKLKSDERLIEECIIEYLRLAKAKDRDRVLNLISRTPIEYWEGDKSQPASNADARSTRNSYQPLDDLAYDDLTGLGLLAWGRSDLDKTRVHAITVNGTLAKAEVMMSFGDLKHEKDFLLKKEDGSWRIFRVEKHFESTTFPF